MKIYENQQWRADLDTVLAILPELDRLAGQSVLITGASGLIGSTIVELLLRYNDTHDTPISIYVAGRRFERMKTRFGDQMERDDMTFVAYDASKSDNELTISADYIIYGAGNAFPSAVMREPVETMICHFSGIKFLLDHAKKHGTKRVLYISSSEVYGQKKSAEPFREDEYGYVDLLNVRNSYAVGKRAAETLCAAYADEYGVDSVIVRPGHIYGPTASPQDNRVASLFAYAAARGEDLVLKSDGSQIRSYCYAPDCASAILKVLLVGEHLHAYNISHPDVILSIRQMAEIYAKTAGVNLIVEKSSEAERRGFNPMDHSSLDSERLLQIGWRGYFDAETGLSHTVQILKEQIK